VARIEEYGEEQTMSAAIPFQYSASEMAQRPAATARKHSKLGLTSFLIALGFPLLFLILLAIPVVSYGRIDNQTDDEISLILIMFGGLGGPMIHFAGLVIGIAGAFQRARKRLFAILGLVFNGAMLLLLAIAWIVFFSWLVKALAWH
jgi:hypothetical protein